MFHWSFLAEEEKMKLIVGLGNPGEKYEQTRHNCGFRVIEKLEETLNVTCSKKGFQGLYVKTKYRGEDLLLLKPTTFMNLSGQSLAEAMRYFRLTPQDIIVIYDDLDIPVGQIRLRKTGNPGGHNGMKNVIQHLGTKEFCRIRVGIGRDMNIRILDYVLQKFPKDQVAEMENSFLDARDAVLLTIEQGFDQAMNRYNQVKK